MYSPVAAAGPAPVLGSQARSPRQALPTRARSHDSVSSSAQRCPPSASPINACDIAAGHALQTPAYGTAGPQLGALPAAPVSRADAVALLQAENLTPVQLFALMDAPAETDPYWAALGEAASDDALWRRFSPAGTDAADIWVNGHLAAAFARRQQQMQPEHRTLLTGLWTGATDVSEVTDHPALMAQFDIALAVVSQRGLALCHVEKALQADRCIVYAAVDQPSVHGSALIYAPCTLRGDPQVVHAAVRHDGLALADADALLQDNFDIVLSAVQHNGRALAYASPQLQANEQIVLAAVQGAARAFADADPIWRANAPLALSAVSRDGLMLAYAPQALQADRAIVLAAVRNDGLALQYADPLLRADLQICLVAVRQNALALQYVAPILQTEPRIVAVAASQGMRVSRWGRWVPS